MPNWRWKLPNLNASPDSVDFVTALARLLRSGQLRDAFAADPQAVMGEMRVRAGDRAAVLQLIPADLEFQAVILLRKRYAWVCRSLPRTCGALGERAWPEFQTYARSYWPFGTKATARDVVGFCDHLQRTGRGTVCPLEGQRARFVSETRRFAIRYVHASRNAGHRRRALQVFFRHRPGSWHEWLIYVGA